MDEKNLQDITMFLIGLTAGCTIGIILGYAFKVLIKSKLKKFIRKLDNVVLVISFIGAALCIFVNLYFKENNVSIQILGFYTSFIFSWLLTKKGSIEEFQNTQHKIAKSTYRHIEDVETAVLVTKNRLNELKNKKTNITKVDIIGVLDNVEIILAGIRTNKEDWEDLLKRSYVKKLHEQDDPEAKHDYESETVNKKKKRRKLGSKKQIQQPENISEIEQAIPQDLEGNT